MSDRDDSTAEATNAGSTTPSYGVPHDDEIKRLRRIEGQVRGLQRMIEADRYCIDILTQVRSAERALQRVGQSILHRHLRHCVVEVVQSGNEAIRDQRIDEVISIVDRSHR